jgi:hypothetical protein
VKCSGHLFRFDFSHPRFPRKKRQKMSDQPVCKKTNITSRVRVTRRSVAG